MPFVVRRPIVFLTPPPSFRENNYFNVWTPPKFVIDLFRARIQKLEENLKNWWSYRSIKKFLHSAQKKMSAHKHMCHSAETSFFCKHPLFTYTSGVIGSQGGHTFWLPPLKGEIRGDPLNFQIFLFTKSCVITITISNFSGIWKYEVSDFQTANSWGRLNSSSKF